MKHLLCVLIAVSAAAGCRGDKKTTEAARPVAPIPAGNFAQNWVNPLDMGSYRVRQLHLRDDTLFIYTTEHVAYAIATSGGALKYIASPDVSGGTLRPPLVLGNNVIFPCGSTIDVFNNVGRLQQIGRASCRERRSMQVATGAREK